MQTRVPVSDAVTGDQPLLASGVVVAQKEVDELVQVYNFVSVAFSSAELLQELAHVKGNLLL